MIICSMKTPNLTMKCSMKTLNMMIIMLTDDESSENENRLPSPNHPYAKAAYPRPLRPNFHPIDNPFTLSSALSGELFGSSPLPIHYSDTSS